MRRGYTYLPILLFLLIQTPLFGQEKGIHEVEGLPYNTNRFVDQATNVSNENWAVVQHPNGLLYAANQHGVLEFDGHDWRLIELPGKNTAFSLALDEQGTVFVGARGDFGRLVPGPVGELAFESMIDYVPDGKRDFLNVWGVHANSDGVIFQANNYLFVWNGERIRVIDSEDRLHTSFSIFDRFFVKKDGTGLLELIGDSLHAIPDGDYFADKRVFMMEPMHDGAIMIAAQEGVDGELQLFNYAESGLSEVPVDPHFALPGQAYTFYDGTMLRENYFAIATLYDGVFVVDASGQLVETYGTDRLIPNDITSVYKDRQGGLWITHYTNGITHVGAPFSLSEYDLPGNLVNDIVRFEGELYIATDDGLFTLNDRRDTDEYDPATRFDTIDVEPTTRMRYSLLPVEDQLLVATGTGVYSYENGESKHAGFNYHAKPKIFLESTAFPGRIYVGMETGLGMMVQGPEEWEATKLDDVNQSVTSLAEASDGSLWFTRKTASHEVWVMTFDEEGHVLQETLVSNQEDLEAAELEVHTFRGEIGVVALPKAIYRVKPGTGFELVRDDELVPPEFGADSLLYAFSIDENRYWTVSNNSLILNMFSDDGQISRKTPQILQFADLNRIDHVFVDNNEVIWLGDKDRMLRYKPEYAHLDEATEAFNPLVRSVALAWSDSVLFAGAQQQPGETALQRSRLRLVHSDNDVEFEFALPDFYRMGSVEYQYKIEGFERGWSDWTSDNTVVYRNLHPGKHELIVRARSGDFVFDTEARFPFAIMPPWYATWWMKLVYGMFALAGLLLVIRYAAARKQLDVLEKEREWYGRISKANDQLRTANASLEQANKMKDEFLANASHELRTPLTAILGFTSVLKEELIDEHQEFAGLIDENGKRLLKTINLLLDLAKLRAGTIQLDMKPLEVNAKVVQVVDLLTQLAKNQALDLRMINSNSRVFALLDEHSFERVLYNLIGNAIKFTNEGFVEVEVTADENQVCIHVRDTGVGIDDNFLPYLFDEFKQEPSVDMPSDGSGLGLAISAKLVDMMNGRIEVESRKGKGSTFSIIFPVKYLEPSNEVAESPRPTNSEASSRSTI